LSMDQYLEPSKRVKPEVPEAELWEIYKQYRVYLHPSYGYMVCFPSGFRVNRETYETPQLARWAINKLPPPPGMYKRRR
jgi:hypothetical protein